MVELVCGKEHKRKIEKNFYQTVCCRTSVVSCDILDHVADEI